MRWAELWCFCLFIAVSSLRASSFNSPPKACSATASVRHFEDETVIIDPPSTGAHLSTYIRDKTNDVCNGLKLSVQQCFGVLRYLIVVFFFEPGKVTLFHHPSPSALETAPVRKSVLQLHLNLTESELSLHRRNNVHISPRTCFSKTLLQPHFGFENEYVDTAELIASAPYGAVGTVDKGIFEKVCKLLGYDDRERIDEFFTSVTDHLGQFARDNEIRRYSNIGNTEDTDVTRQINASMRRNKVQNTISVKFSSDISVLQSFAKMLKIQLHKCIGVRHMAIDPGTNHIALQLRHAIQTKPCSSKEGPSRVLPLNLWNYAFDKTIFDKFYKSRIRYMKPDKHGGGKPIHTFSETFVQYISVLRHPSTGAFIMYHRDLDVRQRKMENGYAAVKILYSVDGLSFKMLNSTVFHGLESNIAIYGKISENFGPSVDYSPCLASDRSNWHADRSSTHYLRDETLRALFPLSAFAQRFKGLGGVEELGVGFTEHVGILTRESGDGINWVRLHKNPILTHKMAALTEFYQVTYDTLSNLVYDHDERRYKIFTRHNIKEGLRGIQVFTSRSECEWNKYDDVGTVLEFPDGLRHKDLSFYTPNANIFPGSRYTVFLSTSLLGYHRDCGSYVTFMYSIDGGRHVYNDIFSVLAPAENDPSVFFQGCKKVESGAPTKVAYDVFDVKGLLESKDCHHLHMYTLKSRRPWPEWDPAYLQLYKFRYGGIAAVESSDWGHTIAAAMPGKVITKPIRIPLGSTSLILNYEVWQSRGLLKVGIMEIMEGATTRNRTSLLDQFHIDRSCPLAQNHLARRMCWQGLGSAAATWDISELAGSTVRLQFDLLQARLYGFMFTDTFEAFKESVHDRGFFCANEFTDEE